MTTFVFIVITTLPFIAQVAVVIILSCTTQISRHTSDPLLCVEPVTLGQVATAAAQSRLPSWSECVPATFTV